MGPLCLCVSLQLQEGQASLSLLPLSLGFPRLEVKTTHPRSECEASFIVRKTLPC